MKIVNRGFIIVRPKKPFIEWVNSIEDEIYIEEGGEPNIYLIEEDFFEEEPLIEQHFKKIFTNELLAITDDESQFPPLKQEIFDLWFALEVGSMVFDIQKSDLRAEE